MTKPSRTLLWLLTGLLLSLLAGGFIWYQWTAFKREQGIVELDWQGLRVSSRGFTVRRLDYAQVTDDGLNLVLQAENVTLHLPGLSRPFPPHSLQIDRLSATFLSLPAAEKEGSPPRDAEQYVRWGAWLPQRLTIADLRMDLPCAKGRCDERGSLWLQHAGETLLPIDARLHLRRHEHRVSLIIRAQGPEPMRSLIEAKLLIDEQSRLEIRNQFDLGGTLQSTGTLAMGSLPEAPWLLSWLSEWTGYEPTPLPDMPADMRLGAGWVLSVPRSADGTLDWRSADGDVRLSGHLPAPWPILGLGELQGDVDLAAKGQAGLWLPTELTANAQLRPEPALVADLPANLRPERLGIHIEPFNAEAAQDELPLQVKLDVQGDTPANLQARVRLNTAPPYALQIEQAQLQLRSSNLMLEALSLRGLKASLDFSGRADLEQIDLRLHESSRATLADLRSGELAAKQMQALLPQPLSLHIDRSDLEPPTWRVQGPLELRLGRLEHPQLLSQGWRWSGQLEADATRLSATGPLSNDSGLTLTANLNKRWNGPLEASGKLQEIFLRAGNPLASSFTAWPAILELNSGRLLADGTLSLPAGSTPPSARLTLEARGLAGIIDRAEISGLDTRLAASLERKRLELDITELRLAQLNPGFTFGPLLLRGNYSADLDHPAQGQLRWATAETRIFGGRLWLKPATLDLAAPQQQLSAQLQGLQLSEMLAAYPTEGLEGSGLIDGSFDIGRSAQGFSVDPGELAARAPGGVLRFRSPKIEALGQSNPAMKIVTEALHDFHYDRLSSDVRYDESGKLNLALRLNGRNPALEGGRPINFSINLEEDIPALLTSLQLSDRVSETIQRRVQEHLQRLQ